MKLIHIVSIAVSAIAFSHQATAQPRLTPLVFQQFAAGLSEVGGEIQSIKSRAGGRDFVSPYETENDALAMVLCNKAGMDVGDAETEANKGEIDLLATPSRPAEALIHFNSACMHAQWAVNNLKSCFQAALDPPVGTWLTVTSDIASVTGKLVAVRATAGCV